MPQTIRPLLVLAALALLALPAQASDITNAVAIHDCAIAVDNSNRPPAPEWNDPRIDNADGRTEIVYDAAETAFARLLDCGTDTFLGSIAVQSRNGLAKHFNDDGSVTYSAVVTSGWSYVRWDLTVKYVQVQRKPNVAARSSTQSGYGVIEAQPWYDMPEQRSERVVAFVEVFPAVFERAEYIIPSESDTAEPWARDAGDAMKMILLHELGHVEAYATAHSRMVSYPKLVDSEEGADEFASTVVRCQSR